MSTPPTPGLALNLDNIHGGLYISAHVVSALWGIACLQTFTYFVHYAKDKIIFKIMVVALWTMSTLQLYCVIAPQYRFTITFWGNPAVLLKKTNESSAPAVASNALPVAIDSGLSICMVYWLVKESKGAIGSHAIVVRLITLTINSGFWTASVALAALITSVVTQVQIYGAVYYVLCSLYCNTVLANLNAREFIRSAQKSEIVFGSNLRFETGGGHSSDSTSRDMSFAARPPRAHPENSMGSVVDENKANEPLVVQDVV
ncbi:hypothetical protein BT96DRAFT_644745 [Gymnopus androsaceus JB14]|uniref:DUF6534 domain-containing protein n=1 Tax=Gymnopus androsaceus JB14 TaxID=1447944 RepID=A0A6A4GG66_9AGAR|nr:hypothetical protein BT96DRAFT_644745 [Gymnopus androsaceus JB14]